MLIRHFSDRGIALVRHAFLHSARHWLGVAHFDPTAKMATGNGWDPDVMFPLSERSRRRVTLKIEVQGLNLANLCANVAD